MERAGQVDQRSGPDRRAHPRGGRRADDRTAQERELREQQVDKYLRKEDSKRMGAYLDGR
ncbi:MAG: hypothetical protein ACRD2I_25475 [Vicinamibacterales bacterium]